MSTKAKRELAETLSKTLVQGIRKGASIGTPDNEDLQRSAYALGYMESFLASLMAENPKVMAAVAQRIQVIQAKG
jgi:hypothetical protein